MKPKRMTYEEALSIFVYYTAQPLDEDFRPLQREAESIVRKRAEEAVRRIR